VNYSEQFLASLVAAREQSMTSLSYVAALVFIGQRDDGAMLSDVARLVRFSSAAATGMADMFERMGLATRKRVDGDRRSFRLTITTKGRDALDMILNPKPKTNV
jgi:DNA-binding MarR family transcriptional regulator